jgi:hypothetical protein
MWSNRGTEAEAIQERFFTVFNSHFPHLAVPEIILEESDGQFVAELRLFDNSIRFDRSYSTAEDALEHVLRIGYSVVCEMADVLRERVRRKAMDVPASGAEQKKCAFEAGARAPEQKESHAPPRERARDSGCSIISSGAESPLIYSSYIHDYCVKNMVVFPEYTIEKQNGVYMCHAVFMEQTFVSKYSFDQRGAKEDVCRLMYNYLPHMEVQPRPGSVRREAETDAQPKAKKPGLDMASDGEDATLRSVFEAEESIPGEAESLSELWTSFGSVARALDSDEKTERARSYGFSNLFN